MSPGVQKEKGLFKFASNAFFLLHFFVPPMCFGSARGSSLGSYKLVSYKSHSADGERKEGNPEIPPNIK